MLPLSLSQALVLYSWFPLAALLFFLLLIARFYNKFCGQTTYHRLYILPIILFGAASVRAAGVGPLTSDPLADLLYAAAGVSLLALCSLLYRRMMLNRSILNNPQ